MIDYKISKKSVLIFIHYWLLNPTISYQNPSETLQTLFWIHFLPLNLRLFLEFSYIFLDFLSLCIIMHPLGSLTVIKACGFYPLFLSPSLPVIKARGFYPPPSFPIFNFESG